MHTDANPMPVTLKMANKTLRQTARSSAFPEALGAAGEIAVSPLNREPLLILKRVLTIIYI